MDAQLLESPGAGRGRCFIAARGIFGPGHMPQLTAPSGAMHSQLQRGCRGTAGREKARLGDGATTVSTLISLDAEAFGQLCDAVADAHDKGYTWDQIADRPATGVTPSRRRFAA